ncbi:MAG: rhodanese-like domain-containing protein [Saprospiraceae bacterium]|nr:rhodanese-like domain-containing protein [Saprospiraceae bacterium]
MKKKFLCIMFSMFAVIVMVEAQNKTFRVMLKTLLSHSVTEVNVAQAKAAQAKYAYLLDAREQREFEVSHLENARFVGYNDFSLDRVADIPKDSAIVVYCSVGYRSEKVGEKLIAAGYNHVVNLYGGIFQWVNEDNPIVDVTNSPTQKVHAYSKSWGIWLKKGEKVYK